MQRGWLSVGIVLLATIAACSPEAEPHKAPQRLAGRECLAKAFEQGRFIALPSGSYVKGADPLYPEERPSMRLRVEGFAIQAHEVTNDQFAAFVKATGYLTEAERAATSTDPQAGSAVFARDAKGMNGRWVLRRGATWRAPEGAGSSIAGKGRHPVVHVTLADARAYASWAGVGCRPRRSGNMPRAAACPIPPIVFPARSMTKAYRAPITGRAFSRSGTKARTVFRARHLRDASPPIAMGCTI